MSVNDIVSSLGGEIGQTTLKEQWKSVQELFQMNEHHALNIKFCVKFVMPFIFK